MTSEIELLKQKLASLEAKKVVTPAPTQAPEQKSEFELSAPKKEEVAKYQPPKVVTREYDEDLEEEVTDDFSEEEQPQEELAYEEPQQPVAVPQRRQMPPRQPMPSRQPMQQQRPQRMQQQRQPMQQHEPKQDEEALTQQRLMQLQRDIERLQNNGLFRTELLFQLLAVNENLKKIAEELEDANQRERNY